MGKKKPPHFGKIRTREHILEDLSINHLERYIFKEGFATQRIEPDYGIDLMLFTFNENGEADPGMMPIQVRSTDHLQILKDERTISFPVEKQHLRRWLREEQPMMLVVYDGRKERAYWLCIQAYFQGQKVIDLLAASESVTVHISMANRVDRGAIRKFRRIREDIWRQRTEEVEYHV